MSFYGGLQATASRLLTDKGQLLTFSRKTTTVFNPVKGKNNSTTSTYTGYGAAFDYKTREIDGVKVQESDIRLLLQATDTVPAINDTTTIDSVIYKILKIDKVSPGGTVVYYEIQLRR
jgi:hypothetical protein